MKVQKFTTAGEYFKHQNLKMAALLAGMFLCCAVGLFVGRSRLWVISVISNYWDRIFITSCPIATIVAPIVGLILLDQVSKQAIFKVRILDKLKHYEDGIVLYCLSIGVANTQNLLAYMITANKLYLGLYVILMFIIPLLRPTPVSASRFMRNTKEVTQLLQDPKSDLRLF